MKLKQLLVPALIAFAFAGVVSAAPILTYEATLLPLSDSAYDIGTSTNAWRNGYFDRLCLTADTCQTAWPSSGTTFGKAFELTTNVFSQSALAPTTTQNLLINGVGTSTFAGGLNAFRQVAAPYFHATSTTATSLFSGAISALSLSLTNALTVPNGGTGVATLTGLALGNGTSAFSAYAGTSCTNQALTALNGSGVGTCSSINDAYWSGTDLAVTNGGTGLSTFGGANTILYTTAADTLSSITAAASSILVTNGSNVPSLSTTLPAFTLGGAVTGNSQSITGLSQLTVTGTTASSSIAYALGIGSTTPWSALSLKKTFGITVGENPLATSTSMTIDWRQGNTQLVQIGGAAVSVSFTGQSNGATLKVPICNMGGGTAGAVTFSGVTWSGGTAPTQTTTTGHCDVWSFLGTQATSTTGNGITILGAQTTF